MLVERVRCQIEQPRVIRCLDDAFETVCAELDCCEDPVCGCTVEPIEFNTEPPRKRKQVRLVRRVRRYQHVVESAKSAFTALVDEPGALTKRVADIETEVKAIEQLLGGEVPPDLKQVYARVLVVRRRLERRRVWNGFETYAEFLDCLCLALATWSDGVEAVAVLTGELARRACRKTNADQWCATLEADPVTEILRIVERNCGSRCEDAEEPEDGEGSQDDDGSGPTDEDGSGSTDDYGHGHGHGHGHGQPGHGRPGKGKPGHGKPGKSPHYDDCGCGHDKPRSPYGSHPGDDHHGHHHHGGHHGHGANKSPEGPAQGGEDDESHEEGQGGQGPRQDSSVT